MTKKRTILGIIFLIIIVCVFFGLADLHRTIFPKTPAMPAEKASLSEIKIPGIPENDLIIIFFHATGCWLSEDFEKTWDKYVELKKGNSISFLKLDWYGKDEKGKKLFGLLREPLGQWSVPMVAFVKNGKIVHKSIIPIDYCGKRMTHFVDATSENAAKLKIWGLEQFGNFIQPIIDEFK